ncbi:Hydroxyacyl-thioester dehydratase type 2 isoform 1 [Schistosoma japonicum]|uniref:Hydroxyacyl-thioester dehydratase type 2 isoform 1 n=1 Tax=Schistosoma japonicum TaxID=6182 RepID=A0A4Z2D228_SCHJA|nr:Hydroxyacyl-thioester dehydratase type 2 isoform 1 [Schistosoma japonicum]
MVLLSSMITRQINRIVFRQSIRLISLGDRISLVRKITAKDVENFAKLTGDVNPIHLDCEYAKQTRYGKCIVHGIFIQGLVSCLLGVHFPGIGCVAYGVNCKFPEPLFQNKSIRNRRI